MSKKFPQQISQDEDEQIIRAIRAGNTGLFYTLVKKYQKPLYNFGFRMCGEARDAEEMVQDAFLNAFRYLSRFRFEAKFKTWLYKIAGSVCLKKRRKTGMPQAQEVPLEDFLPEEGAHGPGQRPFWVSEPLDRLLNAELSEHIRKALLATPEKYRVVVVLRDLEGLSTEETAQALKIKPETVKVRLHRGRLMMKTKIKAYFEDHEKYSPRS
jgi:RNA polymerase sigma-70 factor, ECF subfamily